ncbi:hypothetical protein SpAn4DRAFT_3176 [Sporomusa ovata]|uniref:Uncharacterized protein n=1 Tax=Sporomusa ovata TaxID=2378 RepID=A0A0U1KZB4_9FIRM|nr:hypothetical protein SpAn4DRAFT_3176 [Sporomusa ovata]
MVSFDTILLFFYNGLYIIVLKNSSIGGDRFTAGMDGK